MNRLSRVALVCVLAVSVASPALACAPPPYVQDFQKHPAVIYTGEKKPVDFTSHPAAAALSDADKEKVRKAAESGPNFAGTYRIVYASCGEKCNTMLMVNLETGKVFGLPAERNTFANFRANSRFIVIRSQGGEAKFFVFNGKDFQPTKSTQADS
jgi:hypothetical protein